MRRGGGSIPVRAGPQLSCAAKLGPHLPLLPTTLGGRCSPTRLACLETVRGDRRAGDELRVPTDRVALGTGSGRLGSAEGVLRMSRHDCAEPVERYFRSFTYEL